MKPIGKYILIQQIKEEIKTDSGLLLSANISGEQYTVITERDVVVVE